MIGELLKIGDEVVTEDGRKSVIESFAEIDNSYESGNPGIYVNHQWVQLKGIEGPGRGGYWPTHLLKLVPEGEYEERRKSWKGVSDPRFALVFIRPLPRTKFWEGDWVRVIKVSHPCRGQEVQVARVKYLNPGSFDCEMRDGGTMYFRVDDLELVRRGAVFSAYEAGWRAGRGN